MTPTVAVVGDGDLPEGDPRLAFAEEVGRAVAGRGWRLQTGGLGGVMAAASRGARGAGGIVVGLLPGRDADVANPHVGVAIPTGLGHGRNVLVAQADAIVAVGGGAGTLSELAFGWIFDRLLVARRGDGWSGALADRRVDGRVRFPELPEDRVFGVDTAEEAAETLDRLLPLYLDSRRGVARRP